MTAQSMSLLYVSNITRSRELYQQLLGQEPLQESADFVMFKLDDGAMLSLLNRASVKPGVIAEPGAAEIVFLVQEASAVDKGFASWQALGLNMLLPPQQMPFGYTFLAQDADGHRLRICQPGR
ncbi:VOC family protein [Gallaecimonas mangrovi]|uniref:VOC family protein n=1 Tax=Gallaecimonas mangrovi TaxID=2291597 RepID=UPI000E200819|nr:VOC family protein [Gallaecimonas mangrovi]